MTSLAKAFISFFFTAVMIIAGLKFYKGAQSVGSTLFRGFAGLGQSLVSGGQYGPYTPTNQSSH